MKLASDDRCPFCQEVLEIVCVKFKFFCATMVLACPNCASASTDDSAGASRPDSVMKPTDGLGSLVRRSLAFLLAALVTAAILRHVIHIYGGFSPAEIRVGAAAFLVMVVSLLFVLKRK